VKGLSILGNERKGKAFREHNADVYLEDGHEQLLPTRAELRHFREKTTL